VIDHVEKLAYSFETVKVKHGLLIWDRGLLTKRITWNVRGIGARNEGS